MILGEWGRRVWYVLNRRRFDRELAEEISAHREMLGEAGRFGNALRIREEAREAWVTRAVDEWSQDVRHAARVLTRAPAFAATVVLILSVGISLNLAFFQLLNATALRPPRVKSPETLVRFDRHGKGFQSSGVPYPATQFIRDHNTVLSAVLVSAGNRIAWDGDPTRVDALGVSANWFSELGYAAALGRVFVEAIDENANSETVVVISHDFWRVRFQNAPDVVGRTVRVNDEPAVIIGVAPGGFPDLELRDPQLWLLLTQIDRISPGTEFKQAWGDHNTGLYGRLRPGITPAAARDGLRSTLKELARMQPLHFTANDRLEPYLATDGFRGPRDRKELLQIASLIGGLTLVILLVACANIGNLVLSRAITRLRELGVRAALGASRWRIVREQIVEGLLLAGLAAVAGLLLANWAVRTFALHTSLPRHLDLSPDVRTIGATVGIAVISTLVFGLFPAWMVTRRNLIGVLKEGGYNASKGLARSRLRLALVGAQVAGCCVLLVVAGLMARGLQRVLNAELGFDVTSIAVMDASPRAYGVRGPSARAYWDDVRQRLSARSDIQGTALASQAPLGDGFSRSFYRDARVTVTTVRVEPAFFTLMNIPVISGRPFRPDDGVDSVVIISRRLAMDMYATLNVIGERFPKSGPTTTIIGVAEDAPLFEPAATMVAEQYMPIGPNHYEQALLLVRSRSNPAELLSPMRQAARAANNRVLASTWLLQTSYEAKVRTRARMSTIAGGGSAVALALACFGIFGVVSYGVAARTREIAIRRALGAPSSSVLDVVLRQLLVPVGAGMITGTGLGLGIGWLLAREPFYLPSADAVTVVAVVAIFVLTAAAAALSSASSALRAEPLQSLRHE